MDRFEVTMKSVASAALLSAAALAGAEEPRTGALEAEAAAEQRVGGEDRWWHELGLTAEDVGLAVRPWTTDPSFAELGDVWPAGDARGGARTVAEEGDSAATGGSSPR